MKPGTYLVCRLNGSAFACSAEDIQEIVADGVVSAVPACPPGKCGILFWEEQIIGIRDISGRKREPAAIQVVCRKDGELTAYTADQVDCLIEVTEDLIQTKEKKEGEEAAVIQMNGEEVWFP